MKTCLVLEGGAMRECIPLGPWTFSTTPESVRRHHRRVRWAAFGVNYLPGGQDG